MATTSTLAVTKALVNSARMEARVARFNYAMGLPFFFFNVVLLFVFQAAAQESSTAPPSSTPENQRQISVLFDVSGQACPSATEFRTLLAGRLPTNVRVVGELPFDWVVSVRDTAGSFEASVAHPDGQSRRTVVDRSCVDAVDAMATVLALMIEDEHAAALQRDAEAALLDQTADETTSVEEAVIDTERPPADTNEVEGPRPVEPNQAEEASLGQIGFVLGFGELPNVGLGVQGALGLLWSQRFFALVEIRYVAMPGETRLSNIPTFAHAASLGAWAGVALGPIDLGLVLRGGFLWVHTRAMPERVQELFVGSAGLRVQANWAPAQSWALFLAAELSASFVELVLLSGPEVIWRNSPVYGGMSVGIRFGGTD